MYVCRYVRGSGCGPVDKNKQMHGCFYYYYYYYYFYFYFLPLEINDEWRTGNMCFPLSSSSSSSRCCCCRYLPDMRVRTVAIYPCLEGAPLARVWH